MVDKVILSLKIDIMTGPNYCTLFNFFYLSRGLALYESLCNVHSEFCLYIFAFDDQTKDYLKALKLDQAVIIGLDEFEDKQLLEVKPTRSATEYCWTCTPSVIKYAIERYNLPSCTYLDADMYFYSGPQHLFNDLDLFPVGITPHNYSKAYDLSDDSGKYCVQFVYFKNSPGGLEPLNWWRNECLKWCYARVEDGKSGDQKYLDSFPVLFKGIHDILHPGAGLAPWNILKFSYSVEEGQIMVIDKDSRLPAIFYHYQNLKIDVRKKIIHLGKWYDFHDDVIEIFYKPYIKRLIHYENRIRNSEYSMDDFKIVKSSWIELFFFFSVQRIFGRHRIFRKIYNRVKELF